MTRSSSALTNVALALTNVALDSTNADLALIDVSSSLSASGRTRCPIEEDGLEM